MKQEEYPWLCNASEETSRSAQGWHFRLLRTQLTIFFLVALLGSTIRVLPIDLQKPTSVVIAILLSVGILLTVLASAQRFDKIWFDARAVAESVKTATWRYMVQGNPFGPDSARPDDLFIAEISEIQESRPSIRRYLASQTQAKPISKYMREIRASEFATRKAEYLEWRIRDQRNWYGNKARWNQRRASAWYGIVLIAQISALVWAISSASYGPFRVNFAGLFMTVAAAFTAWSQAKRHEDLTNSYSIASQELINIESLAEQANDEDTFRNLVDQAEDAISREHTMWCAKRNVVASATKKE